MTRSFALATAALALLALALRLVALDAPLWFDEVQLLVELVRKPFAHVVSSYESDNNHPLYSVCAWLSARAFGEHPWALRLPAALFGAGSVALLAALGARVASRREGLLAALLLALSYHHLWFSQNARAYTALLFFTLASTLAFLRLRERGGARNLLLHGALLALGCYAHLTGVYVGAAQGLVAVAWALRRRELPVTRRRAPLAGCVAGGVLTVALHAPMLGAMVRFFRGWSGSDRVEGVWRTPLWMLDATREAFGVSWPVFAAALLAGGALAIASLVSFGRQDRQVPWLFALPPVLGLAASLAMERNLWPRFFFFAAGFAVLIVVRGVFVAARLALRGRAARHAALAATALVVIVALASAATLPRAWNVPKQDFAAALRFVEAGRQAGDAVLAVGLAIQPYEWLYDPERRVVVPARSEAEVRAALERAPRVWVLHTFPIFVASKDPGLHGLLERRFTEAARMRGSIGDGDVVVLRSR